MDLDFGKYSLGAQGLKNSLDEKRIK